MGVNEYYDKNRDKLIAYGKDYRKQLKLKALEQYGTVCYCCGESIPELLTIDHINNDGAAERRNLYGHNERGGYNFYLYLQRNSWPKGFQVACFNCNQGRFINAGICPHQNNGKVFEKVEGSNV